LIEPFIAGVIAGYGIAIPVGPVTVLIIELGMRRGFRTALAGGLGAATADALYATLAAVAGATIALAFEPITPALRLLAALVLAVIAASGIHQTVRRAESGTSTQRGGNELTTHTRRTYLRFLAITLLNPTTVLFFGALMLGRPELGSGPAERTAFIAGAGLASASWQSLLAVFGVVAHRRLPVRAQTAISLVGSGVVAGFAVLMVLPM
jgi:threonine/homoserine/homoserine lactone efflux protein